MLYIKVFDSLRFAKGQEIEHLRYETGNQIQNETHRGRELNSKSKLVIREK